MNAPVVFLLLAALAWLHAAEPEPGFVPIFDGLTLAGWDAMPAATAPAWTVVDGVLRGDGDKGKGYLTYQDHNLRNFELTLQYRLPGKKANTGISIRARKDPTGRRLFQSYHADLGHHGIGKQVLGAWDFHTPGRREHRCFRGDQLTIGPDDHATIRPVQNAVTLDDIHKQDWNECHLIAIDNTFDFFINRKRASTFTEHVPEAKRLHAGMLQLQLHNPGMIAEFKNIRLKVLP